MSHATSVTAPHATVIIRVGETCIPFDGSVSSGQSAGIARSPLGCGATGEEEIAMNIGEEEEVIEVIPVSVPAEEPSYVEPAEPEREEEPVPA